MKSKKNIENKIKKNLIFSAGQNLHDQILNDALKKHKSPTQNISILDTIKMLGIIMTKSPVKLGFAAVIILTIIIYVTSNQTISPNQELVKTTPKAPLIEIPQELSDKSIEELLVLHNEHENSSYNLYLIEAALKQALTKLNSEELLAMATNSSGPNLIGSGGGMRFVGSDFPVTSDISNYNWMTLYDFLLSKDEGRDVIEETPNLFVNAQIVDITINPDDLKRTLVNRQKRMPQYYRENYRAAVKLEILDSSPKDVIQKGQTIEALALIDKEQLANFNIGNQYYIGLLKMKDSFEFLQYMRGIYEVTSNNNPDSLENRFWKFLCDTQDILLLGNKPQQEVIDYWKSQLNSDAYEMALTYMKILPQEFLPGEVVSDTIIQRLLNENSYELACDYMAMLPDEAIPAKAIMDTLEKTYQLLISPTQQDNNRVTAFRVYGYNPTIKLDKMVGLLSRSGDKESMERLITLLGEDMNRGGGSIFWNTNPTTSTDNILLTVQLLIEVEKGTSGNLFSNIYKKYKNHTLITRIFRQSRDFPAALLPLLLEQAEKSPDENTYSMIMEILENPSDFGVDKIDMLKRMWIILGSSYNFDIRSYLEGFIKNPNTFVKVPGNQTKSMLISLEQAAYDVLLQLPDDKRPSHKEQIDLLYAIYTRDKEYGNTFNYVESKLSTIVKKNDTDAIPLLSEMLLNLPLSGGNIINIIAERMPDPVFIPVIKQALEKRFNINLLNLLLVCGDKDSVLEIANQPTQVSMDYINLLFNAGEKDKAIQLALEILEKQTSNRDLIVDSMKFLAKSGNAELLPVFRKYTDDEFINNLIEAKNINYYGIRGLQDTAIIALAKFGGQDVIPELQEIYKTTERVNVKFITALALYNLGDNTGWEILEPITDRRYLEYMSQQLAVQFSYLMPDVLQNPIANGLLGSEKTYDLLLEKLRHYVERDDAIYNTNFFEARKSEIMPLLVEHLSNPSARVRLAAIDNLRNITGQNFGFNPRIQYSQENIIQKWKDCVAREY